MRRFRIVRGEAGDAAPEWAPVNLASESDSGMEAAQRALAEVLQCDHVVVLAGLGTSLCLHVAADPGTLIFPTMSALWRRVSERVGDDAFVKVVKAVGTDSDAKNIEDLLSRCKMMLDLEPSSVGDPKVDVASFVKNAEAVIREECCKDLTGVSTGVHEDFLRRLVNRSPRRPLASLFTTNYDLCFETAASRIGLPIVDGFSFSMPARFHAEVFDYDIVTSSSYSKEPDFVPRLLRLFKLHGSVEWHSEDGAITKKPGTTSPALIYLQVGKYQASYSPPFLEIMSRFQGLLRQRSVGVLSVSCGFNDLHIAEPLLSSVKANPSLRMVVAAPDLCAVDSKTLFKDATAQGATERNPFLRQTDHLISNGDNRLTLINSLFPDLVQVMPLLGRKTEALPSASCSRASSSLISTT